MASRNSSLCGQDTPVARGGERTPLKSLENEMLQMSTPSPKLKSKPRLSSDVKMSKSDVSHCNPEPHLQSPSYDKRIQTTNFNLSMTSTEQTCANADVTFKSFICPGGEVEISDTSHSTEESIILPQDQATPNTCETEDLEISDSNIIQPCCDHAEHPYHNPEIRDAVQDSQEAVEHDVGGEDDVTWKSFACDGGEVEVFDVTTTEDETIHLPVEQLDEHFQDQSVNATNLSDVQPQHVEHRDHPYNHTDVGVAVCTASSETTNGVEVSESRPSDLTFKSFNCTGGEVQVSDGTALAEETIPVPALQSGPFSESYSFCAGASMLVSHPDVQNADHLDHLYCNVQSNLSIPDGNVLIAEEPSPVSFVAVDEPKQVSLTVCNGPTNREQCATSAPFQNSGSEDSHGPHLSRDSALLPDGQAALCEASAHSDALDATFQGQPQENDQQFGSHLENNDDSADMNPPALRLDQMLPPYSASVDLDDKSSNSQIQETLKEERPEFPHSSLAEASSETLTPVHAHLSNGHEQSSEDKDSALGSSGNGPVDCNSAEKHVENLTDVLKVLSECPSVASALQFGLLSPVVRRASLFLSRAIGAPAADELLTDDSALEVEKSLLAPVNVNTTGLWAENMDITMPQPLLNSTALGCKPQPNPFTDPTEDGVAVPPKAAQTKEEKPALDVPLIQEGPLQQQLRQMAEFLLLASGKIGPAAVPAMPQPPSVLSARAPPAECCSVAIGTSPVRWANHSVNTSGQFERKREFSVADSCTLTDPLLWNVPPGSLECIPRQELEQRLRSSMIMVEALVQQLTAARAQGAPAAAAPSDLRDKLVQTDHTELSQTPMHRDLYMQALSRISELELDGNSLQNLMQCMQDVRMTMASLSCDTDVALSNMKNISDIVKDDHQSIVSHYEQMKGVFERTKQTHAAMLQKVKDALQQRDDMKMQMEEAFITKEATLSSMDQLRAHCAKEISELERVLGSQQELSAALDQTYPQLVALNQAHHETLNCAADALSTTMKEQSGLMEELCTVRRCLQKTAPILLQLNERAAAASKERDEHKRARDQAVKEREQMEEEWNQTNLDLQLAREQVGDLSLKVTVLTAEMGVLRQNLTEREEERSQLDRKVTELSATISSTLASYAFLEEALTAETTKLQESWKDIQQARERGNELEISLAQSEKQVCELSQSLAQSEEQLGQLETLSQSQSAEIQRLQDLCTQLSTVREMNEFMQLENEFAREQMAESERTLRANLQGLRERNIECEDLKGELSRLQLENRSFEEELERTRSGADATQLELREKLAQAMTDITLLHHSLRGLANELHASLSEQKAEALKHKEALALLNVERHPSSSFVDSVMVALTEDKEEDARKDSSPGEADFPEPQCDGLFSGTSAFTRIAAVTPKQTVEAVEAEPEDEEQSSLGKLLAGLDATVTELISNLKLVQQRKDAQLDALQSTVGGLQEELEAANSRHQAKVSELQHQLSSLNVRVERGNQALQQKEQVEKTLTKLMLEVQESQDTLNKYKTDSTGLQREVVQLRRSLQQTKVESQFLRGELSKAGGPSAPAAHVMEEKIQLLKEMERLKLSLQVAEEARLKLIDRAKRHQIVHQTNQHRSENELQLLNAVINRVRETLLSLPEVVKNSQQLQQLVEYIG